MIFLNSFNAGDILSLSPMPSDTGTITHLELLDANYDGIYVTGDTSVSPSETLPTEWNFDTIMYAPFNEDTLAGDLMAHLDGISHILIKRKGEGDFEWMIVDAKEVNSVDDLNFSGTDITAAIGVNYQYAAVPTFHGLEYTYSIDADTCKSDNLVIADADEIWVTNLTDGNLDYTRTYPNSIVQTMYSKYPTFVRNTQNNYDVITVNGSWIPNSDDLCDLAIDDESAPTRTRYQKAFVDFLTNDKPKLVKNIDGRMWLTMLSSDVQDSAQEYYWYRQDSFSLTECFDVYSTEDLTYAGIYNVPEEYLT